MKNFIKSITSVFLLIALFGLFSCDREEVKPQAAKAKSESDADLDYLMYFKRYILKHNNSTLDYDADHRLLKVNMTPNSYVQYAWYTQNSVKYLEVKKIISGILVRKVVYTLGSSSNKAIKSLTSYYTPTGAFIKSEIHAYEYTSNTGKLRRIYNTNPNIKETTIFNYGYNDDISSIVYHNVTAGIKTHYDYYYTNPNIQTPVVDKFQFNAEIENFEFYAKIFGRFSKHLPMRARYIKVINGNLTQYMRKYEYNFDPKGFVKDRKITVASNNNLISFDAFEYLVVPVVP